MELSLEAFKKLLAGNDCLLLDTRKAGDFTSGFIPGSLFIGAEGTWEEWANLLIDKSKSLLLIAPDGEEEKITERLKKTGFIVLGFLKGGFEAWAQDGGSIDMIIDVEADELAMDLPHDPHLRIVDVRKHGEYAEGHIKEAENIPLLNLTNHVTIAGFDEKDNIYIHCKSGYRSVIAASLFKQQEIHNIRNVLGGFEKIKLQEGFTIEKDLAALN